MSEIVLRRLTSCPSGQAKDERALEIVLELDDALPLADPTPRTVAAGRLYSRGDLGVLAAFGFKSVRYVVDGKTDFVVTADGHAESQALAGETVQLWTVDSARSTPEAPRKVVAVGSWSGDRFVDEKPAAAAQDDEMKGR